MSDGFTPDTGKQAGDLIQSGEWNAAMMEIKRLRNGIYVDDDGNVGIETKNPTEKLEVNGNILLGPNANFYALSACQNLLLITGHIRADDEETENEFEYTGEGFTATYLDHGRYRITFSQPFSSLPFVLVSPATRETEKPSNTDHIATVYALSSESFSVHILVNGSFTDSDFSFVAFGTLG